MECDGNNSDISTVVLNDDDSMDYNDDTEDDSDEDYESSLPVIDVTM